MGGQKQNQLIFKTELTKPIANTGDDSFNVVFWLPEALAGHKHLEKLSTSALFLVSIEEWQLIIFKDIGNLIFDLFFCSTKK